MLKNGFQYRVTIERAVLFKVNSLAEDGRELHGLSQTALNRWNPPLERLQEIKQVLIEISESISSIADSSREVFATTVLRTTKEIDDLVSKLDYVLNQ